MVALANSATVELLDVEVGLDARAAARIVLARPIACPPRARRHRLRRQRLSPGFPIPVSHPSPPMTPPACELVLTARALSDVDVYNGILDAQTTSDYPYASLVAISVPTCLD